ncbi:MAG: hypothetical protein KME13_05270 [Myxacorys californica WJT36-NPBG1]|nr:hypothetical protein [Myxacorys californica WJT36-NPBG1]
MNQSFLIQDLVISIVAQDLNPSLINPDILRYSGVISADWELARPPAYTKKTAQVTFTNGVNIIGEPNRIMFAESIADKAPGSILVADVAQKYAQSLPNLGFKGVSIDARGYIALESTEGASESYVTEKLLAPGAWRAEGMQASLNLVFQYDRAPLYLTITDALLKKSDESTTPIAMFSGKFNYSIDGETSDEKLNQLHRALETVQADLTLYTDLVSNKFLEQPPHSIGVPNLFALSAAV